VKHRHALDAAAFHQPHDFVERLVRAFDEGPAPTTGDDDIRERILAELAKADWAPRAGLTIVVTDGVVDLNGVIFDDKEREALRVAAENVPGSRPSRITWFGSNRSPELS